MGWFDASDYLVMDIATRNRVDELRSTVDSRSGAIQLNDVYVDDRRLVFCDMRQFGRMRIFPTKKLLAAHELSSLAPEPFSELFTVDYLMDTLSRSRRGRKSSILRLWWPFSSIPRTP